MKIVARQLKLTAVLGGSSDGNSAQRKEEAVIYRLARILHFIKVLEKMYASTLENPSKSDITRCLDAAAAIREDAEFVLEKFGPAIETLTKEHENA